MKIKRLICMVISVVMVLTMLTGCNAVKTTKTIDVYIIDSSTFDSEEQYQNFKETIFDDQDLGLAYKMKMYTLLTGEDADHIQTIIEE